MTIDTATLLASLDIADIIGRYIELKRVGTEHRGLCPFHADTKPSFTVVPHKGRGFYHCWGCGANGDAIAFVSQYEGVGFLDACNILGAGTPPKSNGAAGEPRPARARPPDRITTKPPVDAAPPNMAVFNLGGEPVRTWAYRDAGGDLLGYVARYEVDGRKITPQWTWGHIPGSGGEPGWAMGHFSKPRPLYGLDRLAARPDRPVVIVEGEKAADAAGELLAGYVCITWPGGAQAPQHADWTPLADRDVILWPDADGPGWEAMRRIRDLLTSSARRCRIIDVTGQPEGWDAADALGEGWTPSRLADWAKPRVGREPSVEVVQTVAVPPVAPQEPPTPRPAATVTPLAGRAPRAKRGGAAPAPAPDLPPDSAPLVVRAADPLPPEFSDDALTTAFTRRHADELRYITDWGRWLRWDGRRWDSDRVQAALDLARRSNRAEAEAAFLNPEIPQTTRNRIATTCASARVIGSVVRLAQADPMHSRQARDFDRNPWLLNTPDGTVDLKTGDIRPHDPLDQITKMTRIAPDPSGAECPVWETFLGRVCNYDEALIGFMQRMIGYSLTGDTSEHALFFAYGTGANGKGTMLNLLTWMLGDYSAIASMEAFTEARGDRHPTELASLLGARLVTAQETEEGRRWAESRIKALTGGDPISARFMHKDFFTFMPQFKLIIAGNHKPGLRNVDEAIRRRMHLVPFTQTIAAEERDRNLADKLKAEAPGILAWAIKGCLEWQRDRLSPPPSITNATDEYLAEEDYIQRWIEECCELDTQARTSQRDLYRSFVAWAEDAREFTVSQKRFSQLLTVRGYKSVKSNTMFVVGLRLKTTEIHTSGGNRWQD